jgi:hypothetical protein
MSSCWIHVKAFDALHAAKMPDWQTADSTQCKQISAPRNEPTTVQTIIGSDDKRETQQMEMPFGQ